MPAKEVRSPIIEQIFEFQNDGHGGTLDYHPQQTMDGTLPLVVLDTMEQVNECEGRKELDSFGLHEVGLDWSDLLLGGDWDRCSNVTSAASLVPAQVDVMLSALLSNNGCAGFLSRAVEIAATFGIDLNGVSWLLVQHWSGVCDMDVDVLLDRAKIVRCSGISLEVVGHSLFSMGYRMTDERKAVMRRVLGVNPGPCHVGTVYLNECFVTQDGRNLKSQTGYVFYNEVHCCFSIHFFCN
jgi:hypothetical protein